MSGDEFRNWIDGLTRGKGRGGPGHLGTVHPRGNRPAVGLLGDDRQASVSPDSQEMAGERR
jgi:hypothetical protein